MSAPELRSMAAGLAALEAIRFIVAAARLADDPAWAEAALATVAPRASEWLRLDSYDLPGPTAYVDAWAVLDAALGNIGHGGDDNAHPAR